MPEIVFKGKEYVYNHHLTVPYRPLLPQIDKGIGPGVYDIHSPRVPPVDEFVANLRATLTVLSPGQVWVNPDCGLKTRTPAETHAALANMVAAARTLRAEQTA